MSIDERLSEIERKLDLLLEKSNPIVHASAKMTSHIDFIETVYEKIQAPMHYLLSFAPLALEKSDS